MAQNTVEGLLALDIRLLGSMQPNKRIVVRFARGGEQVGAIKIEMPDRERIVLRYKASQGEGPAEQVADSVAIVYSPCTYGGSRRWFVCPGCQRRAAILYFETCFRCRKCLQLGYSSQQQGPCWRGLSQALKRRVKLGGSGALSDPFPPKPKNMRQEKYLRLVELDQRSMAAASTALDAEKLSLVSRGTRASKSKVMREEIFPDKEVLS